MTKKFTYDVTEEQIERLQRLHASGDWEIALAEYINDLLDVKVGKSTVTNASQFTQKVTGPSNAARFQ